MPAGQTRGLIVALEILMTESFASMFEESLASQRIKPGAILMGRIVEIGPHAQLLEQNGVYANLYRLQFARVGVE